MNQTVDETNESNRSIELIELISKLIKKENESKGTTSCYVKNG